MSTSPQGRSPHAPKLLWTDRYEWHPIIGIKNCKPIQVEDARMGEARIASAMFYGDADMGEARMLSRSSHGRSPHAPKRFCAVGCECHPSLVTKNIKPVFLQLGELTVPLWSARLFKSIAMLAGDARSIPAMLPAHCCTHCSQMICLPPRARFPFDVIRQFLEHLFIGFGSCVF